jgi:hypothetical protein
MHEKYPALGVEARAQHGDRGLTDHHSGFVLGPLGRPDCRYPHLVLSAGAITIAFPRERAELG